MPGVSGLGLISGVDWWNLGFQLEFVFEDFLHELLDLGQCRVLGGTRLWGLCGQILASRHFAKCSSEHGFTLYNHA